LAKLGHEVHVLAGATESTRLRVQEHDGVTVYRFRKKGSLQGFFYFIGRYRMWWTKNRLENAFSMYDALKVLLRTNNYDLIEMPECGAEGFLINHLMRETTVIKLHSPSGLIMPFYDVRKADITCCSFIEQVGIRGAGHISSCSKFLAAEAATKLGITRPIQVIPNGIDLDLFDAADQDYFHSKYKLPQDRLMVLFAGRMEHRKGIHLCKDIAAFILERYDVSFVFAGQDLFNYMSETLLPYLKSKSLKGSVHYPGRLDQIDIRSCLCQADIFLIPSLWENCPYSCLEAMAAGRAIVSSNRGGMPELIRDNENGLLARSEDPLSYISAIERLIENDALRKRLGAAARKTIEESFTDVNIAGLSIDYYRECIHRENR